MSPCPAPLLPLQTSKPAGKKLAVLTAYDYPSGRLLDEAGVDIILVGDSLGMVILGYPDTTHVTLDEMAHHVRAVARGVQRAGIIGDLPIHTYTTPAQAIESGRRLIQAGAHAVKLEGGLECIPQVEALVQSGIPVVGHIGMLPQHVLEEGGYKIKGKTEEESQRLKADALALEAAGALAIVIELIRPEVTREITQSLRIPTIGIGAGRECDGQVLVTSDLIGAFPWFTPKFVTPKAHIGETIHNVVREFVRDLHSTP